VSRCVGVYVHGYVPLIGMTLNLPQQQSSTLFCSLLILGSKGQGFELEFRVGVKVRDPALTGISREWTLLLVSF